MSTILERNISISSLLPAVILHGLQTEDEEKCLDEAAMCAVATLIVNTALGAIKALAKGHYKSFDANPGNAGCQSLAVELRRLSNLGLQDECRSLGATVLRIKELVNRRKGDAKDPLSLPHLFFQKEFGDVFVSKAMEYLLHCYLSAVLRTPYQKLDSGIVMTRSESSKLSMLSSKITLLDGALRRKIVEENQRTLTRLSVHAAHEMASRLTSLELKEKELVVTMLSAENTHVFTPDPQYEPKSFGCLFYEVKTALTHLQEEQAIVCLESIRVLLKPKF
ncbi:MAG: hypothetical protein JSR97_09575 [Verrucomicrobia bacterium]|nr:hypothetical protein [Verrucomicrobiota bacterium]